VKLNEYRLALETCIRRVARRFVANEGEGAFDLYYDAEIEATLFSQLRRLPLMKVLDRDGRHRQLVHLHWPCVESRFIDIVIWHPSDINLYRKDWGNSCPQTAPSRRLLAAVQIKRGGGYITPLNDVMKDLKDLASIGPAEGARQAQLYFIEFADCEVRKGQSKDRYGVVKKALERWCDRDERQRRVLLLSKDRIGFAYPPRGWAVDPLPAGVAEFPR
jgi:hypothetical protein